MYDHPYLVINIYCLTTWSFAYHVHGTADSDKSSCYQHGMVCVPWKTLNQQIMHCSLRLAPRWCINHLTSNKLIGKVHTSNLASSPGPTQKSGKCVTCKIPVCNVSAVFVWSREIMFIHYQLVNSWHMKMVDSFQDHLKMGMRLAYFSQTSYFRKLERSYVFQATRLASQELPIVAP